MHKVLVGVIIMGWLRANKKIIVNNKILILLAAGVVVSGAGYWYYQMQMPAVEKSAGNKKVHFEGKRDLPCSVDDMTSLRFKLNGELLWNKTHEELFTMSGVVPSLDRRAEGKNIVPVEMLLKEYVNITVVEFIPCDNDNVLISAKEILDDPQKYYLGQNRSGRMKLLAYEGQQRYRTLQKNMVHMNLLSTK
jgi:hypothetical protein